MTHFFCIKKTINIIYRKYFYYIKELDSVQETKVITAIAVDDRSQKIDIIAEENLPPHYQMIFLLISESFHGNRICISDGYLEIGLYMDLL